MTEVQNFMLTVCFGCTMGFLIGTFCIMISDGISYLKKKRRKKKEQKETKKKHTTGIAIGAAAVVIFALLVVFMRKRM